MHPTLISRSGRLVPSPFCRNASAPRVPTSRPSSTVMSAHAGASESAAESKPSQLFLHAPQKISPANRWAPPVSRIAPQVAREISKTALVRRSDDPVVLPYAKQPLNIAAVKAAEGHPSLAELLKAGVHDGFLILHNGTIVAEDVVGSFHPSHQTHALNSASKVAVACVVGMLAGKGQIDLNAPLESYLPEAIHTGYKGVTVQQALNMQSGVELDPYDEFLALGEHPQQGNREAIGVYKLAMTRKQRIDSPNPRQYHSLCTDTDMVAMACERITGTPYKALLTDLWQALGAAENADFIVDDYRTPAYNGGLVATLHDVGRLGQMLANGGRVGDRQVVPSAFVADSITLTSELKDAYKTTFYGQPWPTVAYHNTFFVDSERPGITFNYGAFGNLLAIDHNRNMVGVLLSAWAKPNEGVMDWISAFYAVSDHLAQRPSRT